MDKIATENLFLLEFLVDAINIDGCDCDSPPGEMCVTFEFLDNVPLDVCEQDFKSNGPQDPSLKSGKSCLFSLTPQQAVDATKQFDIIVSITKKTQPGWLPEKVEIGGCLISIVDLFNELIEAVCSQTGESPAAKTLKSSYPITNTAGQVIGKIGVYIRMSCFGKLIVTQFQMNLNDKSVLFKDKEGHSLYRYKKAEKSKSNVGKGGRASCGGGASSASQMSSCPNAPCGVGSGGAMGKGAQPMMSVPCNECDNNAPCAKPAGGGMTMDNPCNECGPGAPCAFPVPSPEPPRCPDCEIPELPPGDPDACYQEIGAKMGGNALTIRVHKDNNKVETFDGDGCLCGGGSINGDYKSQPGDNTKAPFALKMGGGSQNNKNVSVIPPQAAGGMKYNDMSDPDKDVFILRIGKKHEKSDKKNNLELELCTPKGPELKPTPKKETRDTQYDPADAGIEGGDGGKKGKKGKGKKK